MVRAVTLPHRINRLRRWFIAQSKKNVSLAELSQICGLSVSALSLLKNARRNPTHEQLAPLSRLTGLSIYELLRLDPDEFSAGTERADLALLAPPAPAARARAQPELPRPGLAGLRPSPDQIQLALRYRVEVGPAWAAFLAAPATRLDRIEAQWRAWVEACGEAPAAARAEAPAPLQTAEGLYAHLRPVERGPDMRPVNPYAPRFVPKS